MSEPVNLSETTVDAFLGGALTLRQRRRGYRAGIDPVLLAARCAAQPGERVLDCGAGIGTVGFCVARRVPGCEIVLVERDETYARLAVENIAANNLADRVRLIQADLTAPLSQLPAFAGLIGTFDHALANPPYHVDTDGTRSSDPHKAAANTMRDGSLDDWVRVLAAMLKPGGRMAMIHRADALDRILAVLDGRFGAISVLPLFPSTDLPANRIIVSGQKGSRAPLSLHHGLVVHAPDGGYTTAIEAVLRAPSALAAI
jgi:tRNA1(Val) A37 N6-methylase TrmN6